MSCKAMVGLASFFLVYVATSMSCTHGKSWPDGAPETGPGTATGHNDLATTLTTEFSHEDSHGQQMVPGQQQRRLKRFTVDFNGFLVSYPQYIRLVRLQEKVMRLKEMIEVLHSAYTQKDLEQLPQYKRLINLYNSLSPLLPTRSPGGMDLDATSAGSYGFANEDSVVALADPANEGRNGPSSFGGQEFFSVAKKGQMSADFMGMRVSYPQYLRLVALQEKAQELDNFIKTLQDNTSKEVLESKPQWNTLMSLRNSLKGLLASEGSLSDDGQGLSKRSQMSMDFMGMRVSYPQYLRLKALQDKVVELDKIIRRLQCEKSQAELDAMPQWATLVALHKNLKTLLPREPSSAEGTVIGSRPDAGQGFEGTSDALSGSSRMKRSVMSADFMNMRVSYPQYLRLVALQEQVVKLDKIMKGLLDMKPIEYLEKIPKWQTLMSMHKSLKAMLPKDYRDTQETFEEVYTKKNSIRTASDKATDEGAKSDGQQLDMKSDAEDPLPSQQDQPGRRLFRRAGATMNFNGVQVSEFNYILLALTFSVEIFKIMYYIEYRFIISYLVSLYVQL